MEPMATNDPVLRRFREELDRAYGDRIERVVLFGSRARGDHREDSDYDIAVFLKDYARWYDEVKRLAAIGIDVLYDTGALISAKPFRGADFEAPTGFMNEVRRDGREL